MAVTFILCWVVLEFGTFSSSLEDEVIQTLEGCPILGINNYISLAKKPVDTSGGGYFKIIFDKEYIVTLLGPHICEEEKAKFNRMSPEDKANNHLFFPTALWLPEKQLYLAAARLTIFDWFSFVYVTFFDEDWNEIRETDYIGKTKVPSVITLGEMKQAMWWGPEDPRIFQAFSSEIFFISTLLEGEPNFNRQINLYQFSTATHRKLELEEHIGKSYRVEKNWSPLIVDDKHLYFLYKYEGIQIIDCTEESQPCKRISGSDKPLSRTHGSSPYVKFLNTNYFVSFAWTNIVFTKPHYRPSLSIIEVLDEGKEFRLIYTSEPLHFTSTAISDPKSLKTKLSNNDLRRVLMITSIARWDFESGVTDINLSIDDDMAVAARVSGLTDFVHYIINVYEYGRLPDENSCAEKTAKDYYRSLPKGTFVDSTI
ncbi:unnamed protein product [Blepharisma stoltei]|uniref:Uncharacterized protein n=1 Tax=Blepharisma stoltei TaxID=1481888 RepID=A0AAU9J8J6_9CILI|nr:unnamed protein product [Blepharisma stoltei]